MSLRPMRSRKRDDDPILPLINIVFLLLIFFLLAGRIAETDPFDLKPPQSISEALDESALMILQVSQNGEVAIDGDIIDPDAFERALEERISMSPPNGVRIKAHGAAAAPMVIELIAHLGDAGIEDLRLITAARRP